MCRTRLYGGPSRLGGESAENLPKGLGGGCDVRVRRSPEVRLVATWDDPDLEGRARRERRERDGGVVLPDHPIGPARSSRTRRHHGHSPSRITNRAEPPSSSATRCGIWGMSYRSRQRWFVRAPAWAPQFWITWRWSVWAVDRASAIAARAWPTRPSMISLPTACSGRCSPGGATIVRQLPLACRLRDRDLGERPVQFTGVLVRANDVECEVLERPRPGCPSPAATGSSGNRHHRRPARPASRTDRDGRRDRRRWRPTSR